MTATIREETLDDSATISNDFFQGDIHLGLEKMRLRLLDLTSRNRLLNFRYTKRSSLRVVDELPDQLFDLLLDGKVLRFRHVPRPRGIPRPTSDEEEQPSLETPIAGSQSSQRIPYPTAKDHAQSLGINTDFELPSPSSSDVTAPRYTDREIQTLHYPEDLESVLRSIGSAARLAVEETGTNMLYLVAGFLEWYEHRDSNQPRMAPLLLLPVTLQREETDDATRTYRYSVQHSGDELSTNISLQERLRRDFGLSLPIIEETETPDGYFRRIQPLLNYDDRWRVRRQVTLTLLSFGKLQMYRDLDPKTWPEHHGPAEHPRIMEFFEGVQRDGISFASEYALDDPEMKSRVPLLIDEADSSQHSALVDAMEGRNLVIEGPPGTGKSQTITNLIAAALVKGKRVLFVSEKLAALEVVRHRLDKVGLGAFCLELHSHKTQKRRLLDDVDDRIKRHGRFDEPRLLEEKRQLLEADRQQLTDYVQLINRPYGLVGQSLHEVIWASQRRRKALQIDPLLVEQLSLPNPRQLTTQILGGYRQAVSQYSAHFAEVCGVDSLIAEHPWFGLRNGSLTFTQLELVLEPLQMSLSSAKDLQSVVNRMNTSVGGAWLPPTLLGIEPISDAIAKAPIEAGDIVRPLLPRLKDPQLRRRLAEFTQWVRRVEGIRGRLADIAAAPSTLRPDEVNEAAHIFDQGKRFAPGAETAGEFDQARSGAIQAAEAIRDAHEPLLTIARGLDVVIPFTRDGLRLALMALEAVRACPVEDLRCRAAGLERDDAVAIASKAVQESAALQRQRDLLSKRFDLRLIPSTGELKEHVIAAANAKWWSFLSAGYRQTRRAYAAITLGSRKKITREQIHGGLRQLLDFADSRQRFETSPHYVAFCAPHGCDIDGEWNSMQRLVKWRAETLTRFGSAGAVGRQVATSLWRAPADQIKDLLVVESTNASLSAPLQRSIECMDAVTRFFRPDHAYDEQGNLETRAVELQNLGEKAGDVAIGLDRLGIQVALRVADVPEVFQLLAEQNSLDALIRSASDIATALQEDFGGAGTDLARIARTIALFDSILTAALPNVLNHWLLSAAAPERLTQLHSDHRELRSASQNYVQCWNEFENAGMVHIPSWLAGVGSIQQAIVERVVSRAECALAAQDTLSAWLDYLRARDAVVGHGLSGLVDLAEGGKIAPDDAVPAFEYVAANALVREAFQEYPTLARFSGLSHEQVRRRFAKLDKESIHLYRAHAARAIDQRPIPAGNGHGPVGTFTELHLIEREIGKQKRYIPIRQLVVRAGRALQALKPCFMMGPLSVAQYLAAGTVEFDLVVMDEASQLKPEDALGSIARARQVVIVGDRMQLPPTSFFDRIGEDEDVPGDDGSITAQALSDAESILDVASGLYKPARLLRWHYRSRHGSLIAFSNKEFYKGRLVVFPSPVAKSPGLGVKLVHVRDGVYENRRNIVEAKRVVDTTLRHMRQRPNESLGIVTLNATQRELVEGIFEQQLKSDPVAREYVESREHGLEPFFIKNLENVQGDERDVIYISVTYGPSPLGHVFQRFGPINGVAGHRRLNVLFTRARRRVVVFSSMLSEDIQAGPGSAWGARALKGYLQFAATGHLEQASFSGREPDSDFEVEVADALRTRGIECVAQVGVAGYFIDLAVKHPTKADTFLLGIECDGKTYHSSVTARDRDRLRQSILEDLGWTIHRIWSTDWFKARERELGRVVARVEALLAEERIAVESDDDVAESLTGLEHQGGATVASQSGARLWEGEIESQPLSEADVRDALQELRREIDRDLPSQSPDTDLLRDEMVDALIRAMPRTKDDWLRKINLDLRLNTDGPQFQTYLDQVLTLTAQLKR